MAIDEKRIETRSWGTSYRGPLAIHAAKGFPREAQYQCLREPFHSVLVQAGFWVAVPDAGANTELRMPCAAVVATCRLVNVLRIWARPVKGEHCIAPDDEGLMRVWHPTSLAGVRGHYSDITTEHEHDFGDYTPGRFGWVLEHIEPLAEPVPARGSLGLWNWDESA